MKKFLSMLLALTLIISALMGVTVLDVSATSVAITPAEGSTPRQINLTLSDSSAVKSGFATGEWYFVQGADSITDADGVEHVKGETKKFATITQETVLGKMYDRFQFEPVTAYDTYAQANYFRMTPTSADIAESDTTVRPITHNNNGYRIFANVHSSTFLPNISSGQKVYQYTFYAYSKLNAAGINLSLPIFSNTATKIGTPVINCGRIYSAEGIPHKIDVLVYSSETENITGATTTATGYVYMVVFVDGAYVSYTASSKEQGTYTAMTSAATAGQYHLTPYFNLATASGDTITVKESDLYIEAFTESRAPDLYDRSVYAAGSASNPLFVVPTFNTTAVKTVTYTARTDENVVYGVEESADTLLTSVLTSGYTSATIGTRKADFSDNGLVYLSDLITDTSNTNVTAVNRTTGEQIPVENYSFTEINDALLMVNGVYVLPTGAEPATVTRGIKQDYISMFELAADGGKIDLYSNVYVSELFESNENNDVLINDIPVTAVYNATEYTDLAAMTDVPLKDVTFKYNNKTFGVSSYGTISGKVPFKVTEDGLSTRIRRSYYTSSKQAETPFGGLVEGFYKFDSEPRSTLTFNLGAAMYDQDGYYQINSFPTYNMKTGAANIALNVNESRYFTMNFDMFLPDYDGVNARLAMCPGYYDANNKRIYNGSKVSTLNFVTQQKNYDADASSRVLLAPNTWNNISIVFDGGDVANGNVKYSVYVNGELTNISNKVITNDYFKVPGADGYVSFDFFRFYPAQYTSLAIKDNSKWYYGIYTPQNESVQTDLSITDDNVTIDNVNDKIITENITQADLEALLEGTDYNPVYSYSYASASEMTAAYNEKDDKKPAYTTNEDGNYVYTNNRLIDRWVRHAYDSESENGVKSSGVKDSGNIVSITYDSETGHYTLTVKTGFTDNTIYDEVTTSLEDVIASKPELRDEVLIGVAVTDSENPDLLPRVYTWVQSGAEISGINVNGSGEATLYYQRYGTGTVTGKFILAAFDTNYTVVGVKAKDIAEFMSAGGEGTDLTMINKFDTVPENAVRFRAFVFDGLSTLKPLVKATNYVSAAN